MSLYREAVTKELSSDDVTWNLEGLVIRLLQAEGATISRFVGLSDQAQVARRIEDWQNVMGIHFTAMDAVVSSLIASHRRLTDLAYAEETKRRAGDLGEDRRVRFIEALNNADLKVFDLYLAVEELENWLITDAE